MEPYEPKRINRWIVKLPKEFGIESWVLSGTDRPSLIKKYFNFFGLRLSVSTEWQPITLRFRDPIAPSTSQKLMSLIKEGKSFSYNLELLDPTGIVVEKWLIKDCIIKSVDFSSLTYDYDGFVSCIMVVLPNSAELEF